MKRTLLIATGMMVLFASVLFAEEDNPLIIQDTTEKEESIVLPEVTTVVSGDSLTAGKEALPDFNAILPSHTDGVGLLPQLPGVTPVEIPEEPEAVLDEAPERAVYAQGLLGAGYPGYFVGDFSIYKSSGDDPFLLQFSHTQSNGYGRHPAGDGFFDSDTLLLGEKTFAVDNFSFISKGSYNTFTTGLQGKSNVFCNMNYQEIKLSEKIILSLPVGFSLNLDLPGEWYHRYAGVINASAQSLSGDDLIYLDKTVLSTNPSFTVDWKYGAFAADLSAAYAYYFDGSQRVDTYHQSLHRGEFGTSFHWSDLGFHAGGDVSFLISTRIGNNPYLVPFTVDFGGEWKIGASLRPLTLDLQGGMKSEFKKTSELEQKSLYALHNLNPTDTMEVSDWFAAFKMSIPLLSSFTIDTSANFAYTAFGNGDWVVDYTNLSATTQLYDFAQKERMLIESDLALSYTWKLCTFALDWHAYWGNFVPADGDPFALTFSFNIQDEEGIWGGNLSVQEALGDGVDYVPVVNMEAYYRFMNNFRLALQVEDAVKLISGEDRSYSSSQYIAHAGGVNLLVRFFF